MPDEEEPPWGRCKHCTGTIYQDASGRWIHCFGKSDKHEAEPVS